MINKGSYSVLGIRIHAVDYQAAVSQILRAAVEGKPCSTSALAVHGVMTGVHSPEHAYRLNHLDLVVPDGQPVRWALNRLHGVDLRERVYGPQLTLEVCRAAAHAGLPVFLYGSRPDVLDRFSRNLCTQIPSLIIAGARASAFRQIREDEMMEVASTIKASGAKIVLVGLGCPRQEVWAYEYRDLLQMPILAVGAAFDFHAGTLPQAPGWMQRMGLEWAFRLRQEPRRLWRRYLILNPLYVMKIIRQYLTRPHGGQCGSRLPTSPLRYG